MSSVMPQSSIFEKEILLASFHHVIFWQIAAAKNTWKCHHTFLVMILRVQTLSGNFLLILV